MADRNTRLIPSRDLRSAIEGRIVDVLDGLPQLRPERSRHLLLDMVARWSGMSLQVADYPTPRQWFIGLVGACAHDARSITTLLEAVARLQPDPPAVTTLRQLRDEWDAAADAPGELGPLKDLRPAIEGRIVDVLDSLPQLREEDSRHLLLDMVARWSGMSLQVADYPTPRQWFFGLVGACAKDSRSITMLLAAVARLQPDLSAATVLMRLRDEWDAAETAADAPGELWSLLSAELSEITHAESVEPYRAATGDQLTQPPPHCADAWHVFLHLVGLNAEVGGLPPYMIFLECIAHRLSPATAGQVDRWNRRRAYAWGMAAELDRARLVRPGQPTGQRPVHLIIQFEPDHLESGRYLMSWWYQWDADEDSFELGGQRLVVQTSEMERQVGTVVLGLETAIADRDDPVVIEFILPHEMLGLPVDWWLQETHAYLPVPLAKDYPVMLRSLERMRARHWHRVWHQRWGELGRRADRDGIHWSRPDGDGHLDRLETALVSDSRLVALVLSEPPGAADGIGTRELEIAMRCGLPVVIWSRQESPPGAFTDAIQAFVGTSGILDLPDRVRRLRLDALLLSPGERDSHLGRHLALLWDDPTRQPERGYVLGEQESHLGQHLALLWDDPDRQPGRGSVSSLGIQGEGNGQ